MLKYERCSERSLMTHDGLEWQLAPDHLAETLHTPIYWLAAALGHCGRVQLVVEDLQQFVFRREARS